MKWINFGHLIVFIILITSCVNTKVSKDGAYSKIIIDKYFRAYAPDEYISINKPENKYSITKIWKARLSLIEYKKIDIQLKKDGWKLISNKDNFYEYCFGEKIYLGALFPEKDIYYSFIGHEVKPSSQNNWVIFLYYNERKVNDCRKEKLPIIELE